MDLVDPSSLSSVEDLTAQQRIIDSLDFPQIDERKNKIPKAHESTYEWVLDPLQSTQQFGDLLCWSRSREQGQQLYWIYGKPGTYLIANEELSFTKWYKR